MLAMLKTIKKQGRVGVFLCLMSINLMLTAQESDTLRISLETGVLVSTDSFNPSYLVHNRWGKVTDDQRAFVEGRVRYSKKVSKNWRFEGNLAFRNKQLYESSISVHWNVFKVFGGRSIESLGGIENNELTTGSLAVGRNALPVPQIGLEVDYIDLPFSQGYVKLKGGLSHGWFEEDRYISKALLHQKYAKVLIDLEDIIGSRIYSSIIHFAQYGGVSPLGDRQPSSFDDFLTVFFGQGIPNPLGGTAGESNALGNHVGITEWTWDQKIGEHRLQINYQKPFEDQGSMQYISFKDFFVGFRLLYPEDSKIKALYVEWIRSISQSQAGLPDPTPTVATREDNFGYEFGGRDDYYNNWLYQNGWTYKGRILSNPLFLTYNWALNFLSPFPNYSNQVINNRLNAFHFGADVELSTKLKVRSMMTFTINKGTYAGLYEGRFAWEGIQTDPDFDYVFLGGKNQFYSLIDLCYESLLLKQPVNFKAMFAFDTGQLYTNAGLEFGVEFMLK